MTQCVIWNAAVRGKKMNAQSPGLARTTKAHTDPRAESVPFRNILYCTDFSRPSNAALPFALSIARRYGSKVFVAHVISLSPFSNASPTLAWQSVAAQAAREANDALASLEPQLKGAAHQVLVRKGEIWPELSAIIEQEGIDLVVVGTHGRTRVSKVLMGSVAETIFRRSPCPVLTVGPNVAEEPEAIVDMHTILFPSDFSAESTAALPFAISLAQEHQSRLYLLHVASGAAEDLPEVKLKTALHNLIPPRTEFICEPKMFVASGEAAPKILELAEELAVDLIVLGVKPTPRLPGTSHLAMATAYKIVTGAICPVLTVRGRP